MTPPIRSDISVNHVPLPVVLEGPSDRVEGMAPAGSIGWQYEDGRMMFRVLAPITFDHVRGTFDHLRLKGYWYRDRQDRVGERMPDIPFGDGPHVLRADSTFTVMP